MTTIGPNCRPSPAARSCPTLYRMNIQDGFALVSARVGYNFRGNQFRIEGFVENIFDKDYIKDAGNTGDSLGMATFIPGEPRTYGVQLTARF